LSKFKKRGKTQNRVWDHRTGKECLRDGPSGKPGQNEETKLILKAMLAVPNPSGKG